MTDNGARRTSPAGITHNFAADDVLRGLPPELVILLARLAGDNLKDLSTTIEYMPYAYRAAMSAYGMIEMGKPRADRPRLAKAKPFCLEVTAAAANFIASIVDPTDVVAKIAADAGATPTPFVPVVPSLDLDDMPCVDAEDVLSFNAVLQPSDPRAARGEWVLVINAPDDQLAVAGHSNVQTLRIRSDLNPGSMTSKHVTVHTPYTSLLVAATITEDPEATPSPASAPKAPARRGAGRTASRR